MKWKSVLLAIWVGTALSGWSYQCTGYTVDENGTVVAFHWNCDTAAKCGNRVQLPESTLYECWLEQYECSCTGTEPS